MTARRFWVSGKVQGVFFREWTRQRAEQLGIAGHALNTADGRVEVIAYGSDAALEQLAEDLWQGPPAARVEQVAGEALGQVRQAPEGFVTGWKRVD